jgi:hypothetical protein
MSPASTSLPHHEGSNAEPSREEHNSRQKKIHKAGSNHGVRTSSWMRSAKASARRSASALTMIELYGSLALRATEADEMRSDQRQRVV